MEDIHVKKKEELMKPYINIYQPHIINAHIDILNKRAGKPVSVFIRFEKEGNLELYRQFNLIAKGLDKKGFKHFQFMDGLYSAAFMSNIENMEFLQPILEAMTSDKHEYYTFNYGADFSKGAPPWKKISFEAFQERCIKVLEERAQMIPEPG